MTSISSGWKVLALPVLLLCELIRNCKMLTITVQLQPQQFDFPLKTRVANYLLTRLHIYQPTWNPRVIPNRVPAVRSTKGRHSTMRTSLSSAGVSWRIRMGYPSYASNRACTSPFFSRPSIKIVLTVHLAAHAKRSTLCGRPYGHKSNFFRLDGLLLFGIITGLRCARCELRYNY